ncbi:MAG TPA: hypothetical protein VFB66_20105 [Tepidisphaeraceae bacterium]|nr:hypothetical protein [Tepidisphaeraceae bacterium]
MPERSNGAAELKKTRAGNDPLPLRKTEPPSITRPSTNVAVNVLPASSIAPASVTRS